MPAMSRISNKPKPLPPKPPIPPKPPAPANPEKSIEPRNPPRTAVPSPRRGWVASGAANPPASPAAGARVSDRFQDNLRQADKRENSDSHQSQLFRDLHQSFLLMGMLGSPGV